MRHARLTAPEEDEVHLWGASLDVDRRSLVRLRSGKAPRRRTAIAKASMSWLSSTVPFT